MHLLSAAGSRRLKASETMSTENSAYTIIANGMDMGTWEATSADAAIDAYLSDAGYASREAAAEVLGQTVEAMLAELEVIEA